jgi:hypothetical protein
MKHLQGKRARIYIPDIARRCQLNALILRQIMNTYMIPVEEIYSLKTLISDAFKREVLHYLADILVPQKNSVLELKIAFRHAYNVNKYELRFSHQ